MRKGISLVALVITIIVLIILTATVMIMFKEGGILGKSEEAVFKSDFSNILDSFTLYKNELMIENLGNVNIADTTDENKIKENIPLLQNNNKSINEHKYTELIQIYDRKIYQSYDISNSKDEKDREISRWLSEVGISVLKEVIYEENDYVGYYADIDANGTVDGIIYADLLHGVTGQWVNEYGAFSYSTISSSNVKKYYVSIEDYSGPFGTKDVISPIGSGEERFYVMTLDEFKYNDVSSHYYYNKANSNGIGYMTDWSETTSVDFGTGRRNTINMMEKWNNEAYGEKTEGDIWGLISDQVNNGWFIPSRGEYASYKYNLKEKATNFDIWTSSQKNNTEVWATHFDSYRGFNLEGRKQCVILSTTF